MWVIINNVERSSGFIVSLKFSITALALDKLSSKDQVFSGLFFILIVFLPSNACSNLSAVCEESVVTFPDITMTIPKPLSLAMAVTAVIDNVLPLCTCPITKPVELFFSRLIFFGSTHFDKI